MANTYNLISSITVGSGGAADIEFTNIPGTYTDLNLIFSTRDDSSQVSNNLLIKFNGLGDKIDERAVLGTGSSVLNLSNQDSVLLYSYGNGNTSTSNTFGNGSLYIYNYASSNSKSTSLDAITANNSATSALTVINAGLFKSSSAITSITLIPYNFANFLQYSSVDLYGISNT
jgi:hypothetical protein